MPSDNLEEYFKEQIQLVQHTLPPGGTWNPEATWLKLQNTPVPVRKKNRAWVNYAAVFVFALLSGITRQYWLKAPAITNPVAATNPPKEIMLTPILPEPAANNNSSQSKTGNVSSRVETEQPKPVVATDQKKKVRAGVQVIARVETKLKKLQDKPEITETLVAEKEAVSANNPPGTAAEMPEAVPIATPIKITVVLGANSSARILNATVDKNLPDKRRKNRFRMTVPEAVFPDKNHFAITDSSDKPLRLQAKIDL